MPKSKSKSKSSIPDRWMNYSNIGEVIEGTQFITFKVPLKEAISVPKEQKFTPKILLETLFEKNLELGLLVDLTNTRRYYDSTEFEKNGVLYEKIFVPGHVVPTDDIFGSFSCTIDSFLDKNHDRLVGIHCTHGVNRTGYMVCRYMIEKLNIDPEDAIKAYGVARGYNIERENYLEDLRRRGARKTSAKLKINPVSQEESYRSQQWNNDQVHPHYRPFNRFAGRGGDFGPGRYQGRHYEIKSTNSQERLFKSNQGRRFNSFRGGHQDRQNGYDHGGQQWSNGHLRRPYNNDYEYHQRWPVNYDHVSQWVGQSKRYHTGYQGRQFVNHDSQQWGRHSYSSKSNHRLGQEHNKKTSF